MKSKKLGVIGGMGPMATSMFLEKLILNTVADRDQDHVDTVILNHASIPDRTEAILNHTGQDFLKEIDKDIKILEYAGVENIAIPCNTSHYFYNDMQAMTDIPIINMVEKTVEHIYQTFGKDCKVAILATKGTIKSEIYTEACQQFNLEAYIPEESLQEIIMDVIYQYKMGISYEEKLEKVIDYCLSNEKVTCVILGCTELSCINIPAEQKKSCIDPMDILVEQSIRLSGKEVVRSLPRYK